MRRGARVSKPASDELTDAVRWYEAQRPGLGAELFDAVTATIEPGFRKGLTLPITLTLMRSL